MSRKTPGEVRARTCGTKSPGRSEALRFIDSSKSPQVRARTSPGVFRDMALLGLCLELSFSVLYCRTQANLPSLSHHGRLANEWTNTSTTSMLWNNLSICEHCMSKESALQWSERMHQDLSWQQLIHNWSDAELRFALQVTTTNTAPSAWTFDGGASLTSIQPAVSAGNQPPLVTLSMLAQSHSNKAVTHLATRLLAFCHPSPS